MRVDGAVAVGLIVQIVDAVKLAPTNIRAFSKPWNEYAAVRIEKRLQHRCHRHFAAHGCECGHRVNEWMRFACRACSASFLPASSRSSGFVRFLLAIAVLRHCLFSSRCAKLRHACRRLRHRFAYSGSYRMFYHGMVARKRKCYAHGRMKA